MLFVNRRTEDFSDFIPAQGKLQFPAVWIGLSIQIQEKIVGKFFAIHLAGAVVGCMCFFIENRDRDPVISRCSYFHGRVRSKRGQCGGAYQFCKCELLFLQKEVGVRHFLTVYVMPETDFRKQKHGLSIQVPKLKALCGSEGMSRRQDMKIQKKRSTLLLKNWGLTIWTSI